MRQRRSHCPLRSLRQMFAVLTVGILSVSMPLAALAEIVTLKNGIQLRGNLRKIPSIQEGSLQVQKTSIDKIAKIVVVDDQLRRVYVSSNNVRADGLGAEGRVQMEEIRLPKRTAVGSKRRISSVGPILRVTDFNEFGIRTFSMSGPRGPMHVIQGITLITPNYTKVEALQANNAAQWDMRIATSSIPRETLTRILSRVIDQEDPHDRLRVVTLYIQAKRYRDALIELEATIKDFPQLRDLETQRKRLYQLVAEDVIREIESRRDAGQHGTAYGFLKEFPEEDVAGEILLKVGDILKEYERFFEQKDQALTILKQHAEAVAGDNNRELIQQATEEITRELNINTMGRMADYLRLADDEQLDDDQKLSLAISAWLLGSGEGIQNLAETLSLYEVRNEVVKYLQTDANQKLIRDQILTRLNEMEGSSPQYVAKLIANMKPAVPTQFPEEGVPGMQTIQVPGLGEGAKPFEYVVQLPPEYDPYRRYPCVVSLHAAGAQPETQIDWWAGSFNSEKNYRFGQATRHGYIVIAPKWTKPRQRKYGYSFEEHAAVLTSFRDACQRFSIDTDRVFLSGHSMGGDAAWDIGLSHPDLWAGVLPVVPTADKYVSLYWENAKQLPMYFVAGELDGGRMEKNARDLDRYFKYAGFDATCAVYIGRGHEHFQDEIQYMFDWMSRQRRAGMPEDFEVVSMRPWDRFFWWLELDQFPDQAMVMPEMWPKPKVRRAQTSSRILPSNGMTIKSPAAFATVWLSPEFIDFNRRFQINGKRVEIEPSTAVILEDVRTRGDRYHPFWAVHQVQLGRSRGR